MKRIFIFLTICCVAILHSQAQLATGEPPYGFKIGIQKQEQKPIILQTVDKVRIENEDTEHDQQPGPVRYAYPIEVDYTLENSGIWQRTDDGGKIWQLRVSISGALSTNTYYNKFWLPEGSKFFVYSEETKQYIGAITSEYIDGSMDEPVEFATAIIYGEYVVYEYYQPASVQESPIISISRIDYGYRYVDNPYANASKSFGDANSCNININCSEGNNWQTEKHAVARVAVHSPGGSFWCSCALVNNTRNDYTPYVLTANHCLEGLDAINNNNASQWVFYWEYEHSGCTNSSIEPSNLTTTGATVVANNSDSDFALLRLNSAQVPQNVFGVVPYYLGWDRSGNAGTSGVCIHHPKGDVKKISAYNKIKNYAYKKKWYNNDGTLAYITPKNTHWRATFYNGLIEGGSSGSPLINNNHKVIGQLDGGKEAKCSDNKYKKYYGKFNVSWTGNGATDNRRKLQPWLDSANTGVEILGGRTYTTANTAFIAGPDTINVCNVNTYIIHNVLSSPSSNYTFHWRLSSLLSYFVVISSGANDEIAYVRALQCNSIARTGTIYLDVLSNGVVVSTYSKNITVNPGSTLYNNISTENFTINSNTTWFSSSILGVTATVAPNVTLTITNDVRFTSNAKIIVEPNGKLILNDATLTNTCGEMWQGIELENAENGQSATLEMTNSLIENAICAVKFVSDSTKTSSKESTITASNSTFKNNCIDIDIEKKTPTYTTVASNFNTCNFIVDANYMGVKTIATPNDHIHVKLYGTSSKTFRGCNFVGEKLWRGIFAEDAGFTVREKCTNPDGILSPPPCDLCADYTASSFSGFTNAIDVNNSGNQRAFTVKRTDFAVNNTRRINVASSNNYSVMYSNLEFPAPGPVLIGGKPITYYGIYSQNSSGYDISNNSFYQSSSIFAGNNFGIVMRNSGTANNIIILNKFENLNTGLNVMQTNGSTTGTPSGLTFSCNYFAGNKYDISLSQNSTIKSNQGSLTAGANNSFVGTQTSSIYSGGSQLINYYHRNSTPYIPYNPTTAYITPIATTSSPHLLACDYVQCLVAPKNAIQQYQELQNNNQDGSRDSEMTQLSNAAVHALMTDSLPHLDELKQWYSIINTPIAKYSLAETNFELKNYAEAENVLAEIPAMFEFGDKEQIEHNNYLDFHNFKKNLIDSERSYYDLTDAELSNLKQIASTGNGRSTTMAKGVLCFFYGICLEDEEENYEEAGEIFYAPSQQNSSPEEEIAEENNIVYPNPTNNFIYFDNFAKKSVSLHNSNGILLETTRESFMDLSKYSAGTYFLNINSKMVKVVKK